MDFREERGIGYCGLACVLCNYDDNCPGCRERIAAGHACSAGRCAADMTVAGCRACTGYDTCGEGMPHGKRSRAFNRYAREFGVEALIDRLRINDENGIIYHTPDKTPGDYDKLETEGEIYQLLRYGRNDPYVVCPKYESEHFLFRLVSMDDAEDLLKCYSSPEAQKYFNSDNCLKDLGSEGTEYPFQNDLMAMQRWIELWLDAYRNKGFIRWSIVDKQQNVAIGTIEMFGGKPGILRIDLRSDYEHTAQIDEILDSIFPDFFTLFDCAIIATKAVPAADERIAALKKHGFVFSDQPFVGGNGTRYGDYWILE